MFQLVTNSPQRPWNKGKLIGQKPPLKLHEIWAIRIRLQLARRARDLALFNLAIDSKLRGCDLVRLRVMDVAHGGEVSSRAMVLQRKTGRPVRFEITEQTRTAIADWIEKRRLPPLPASVSELHPARRASINPPVTPMGENPGRQDRSRTQRLRHPLASAHQGHADLSPDEKPAGGAATART